MSILTVCESVGYQIGVQPPTIIFNAATDGDKKWKALLEAEMKFLRSQRIFPQQKTTGTITFTSGVSNYSLPADFYSNLPSTEWNSSQSERLIGPLSDSSFSLLLYGQVSHPRTAYRVFGYNAGSPYVQVNPTPGAADVIKLEYVTKKMYAETPFFTVIQENITADTNNPIFDEELVIQGLKVRYLKAQGQEFQQEQDDYGKLLAAATTRYYGTFIGRMDRPKWRGPYYTLPDGGWNI